MKRLAIFFLLPLTLLCLSCSASTSPSELICVDILNVGKADCIVISAGDERMMIDTGEEENLPEILSYLQQEKIQRIDKLILTHFDKDHIGGAAKILSIIDVGEVIQSSFSSSRKEFSDYHSVMQNQGFSPKILKEAYSFFLGECAVTVFPPKKEQYARKEDNNASLIVSVECKNTRFLFCGDAMEERLEEWTLGEHGVYSFVKLPYHGNYLENYSEFLDSTSPQFAAICSSKKNPASEQTLKLLQKRGISFYQTQNGLIHVQSDGNSILINQ